MAGFSARDGDVTVNIDRSSGTLIWDLSTNVSNAMRTSTFQLGAASGSGTTIFTTDLQVNADGLNLRSDNGVAAIDGDFAAVLTRGGAITNDAILNRTGDGTLRLSEDSPNFDMRLNLSSGTTLVDAAITSDTANTTYGVNVAAGATLGGTGSITLSNSASSVVVSGSIAPGNSIGTLTLNSDVTWNYNTNNEWVFELGSPGGSILSPGTSDLLAIDGDFLKGTGSDFTFDFANTGALGWYQLISWTGTGASFDFSDFLASGLSGALTGDFTVASDGLYLQVVPEPATWLLAGLGLTVLLYRRRR